MSSNVWLLSPFILFAVLGGWVATQSWDGVTYVYTGSSERRLPAAVGKGVDFSELKGHALFLASQKRVVEELKILSAVDAVGVELGHFLVKNPNGEKQFACNKYPKVLLRFQATGIAESGEVPTMDVEASCVVGESLGKLEPIWIPAGQLMQQRPGNFELKLNDPQPTDFRFEHMTQSWPTQWVLESVSLFSEKTGESLVIRREEILSLIDRPIEIGFPKQAQ